MHSDASHTASTNRSTPVLAARRLALPAVGAGLLGGLGFGLLLSLVMGVAGMGFASPLNLGVPAFVYTITPPLSMAPTLMAAMGITPPPGAMAQLGPALHSGHPLSPAMADKIGGLLSGMHLPAKTVANIGKLMTGHASNSTAANLMKDLPANARHKVMAAMPLSASHVTVGAILHFAYAGFLGLVFAALIFAAAWLRLPGMRTSMGIVAAATGGGALLYVVMRWVLLPATNPMMALVPQLAFFLAHLLFGLIVGILLTLAIKRRRVLALLPGG